MSIHASKNNLDGGVRLIRLVVRVEENLKTLSKNNQISIFSLFCCAGKSGGGGGGKGERRILVSSFTVFFLILPPFFRLTFTHK